MTEQNKDSKSFDGRYGYIFQSVTRNKELDIEAKALFSYLSSFAGKGNTAFPSVSLICSELKISENRFHKYKNQLIDEGFITVHRDRTDNGFSKNIYTLYQTSVSLQNVGIQNVGIGNVAIQNEGTKNNSIKNNSIKNKNNSAKTCAFESEFNEWWNLYNKKVGKKKSSTKFKSLRKVNDFELIMNGTKAYLNSIEGVDKQYQKDPYTFLNGEHFNDEYFPKHQQTKKSEIDYDKL